MMSLQIADKAGFVGLTKLKEMDRDTLVIVNRVLLNYRLVETELAGDESLVSDIIRNAIKRMTEREKVTRRIVMGPTMRVEDVLNVFSVQLSLPQNAFVLAKDDTIVSKDT